MIFIHFFKIGRVVSTTVNEKIIVHIRSTIYALGNIIIITAAIKTPILYKVSPKT